MVEKAVSDRPQSNVRRITSAVLRIILVVVVIFLVRIPILSLRGGLIANQEPVASIVEKSLFLGVAVLLWWTIGIFIERLPLTRIGFGENNRGWGFVSGLAAGAGLITVLIGIYSIAGWYRAAPSENDAGAIAAAIFLLVVTALFEEILFRAILFRFVEEITGSWIAIAFSSLAFVAAHVSNPSATWVSAVALTIAGAVFCLAFVATRTIWFVTGLHIGWNVGEAIVFGVPVSGVQFPSMVQAQLIGPDRWTGGGFGPEASIPCALISLATGCGLACYAIWRKSLVSTFRQPRPLQDPQTSQNR